MFSGRKKVYIEKSNKQKPSKKEMKRLVRRELYMIMLSVFAVSAVILGSSYAIFSSVNKSKDYNQIDLGTLVVEYEDTGDGLGDIINLADVYPVSDATGLASNGYKFKITDTGTLGSNYTIRIADDEAMIEADECEGNQLPKEVLKYSLNGGPIHVLGETDNYTLDTGFLEAGKTRNYELKMWISDTAGNEILGKHFHGKIVVELTANAPGPNVFASDDWATIINNVRNGNTSKYNVGDTKEIKMGGEWGTQTLRIANKTTTEDCTRADFSETACGFVIEFKDIITRHRMSQENQNLNVGGWEQSSMREYLNTEIYSALPEDLKLGIIKTRAISGYGPNDSANFKTEDFLYLFSITEIYHDIYAERVTMLDSAITATRQLDYYRGQAVTTTFYDAAKKQPTGGGSAFWFLRTAALNNLWGHTCVNTIGGLSWSSPTDQNGGVSPAFRIG